MTAKTRFSEVNTVPKIRKCWVQPETLLRYHLYGTEKLNTGEFVRVINNVKLKTYLSLEIYGKRSI